MENNENNQELVTKRLICYYCGTIYDEQRGRCPLCGSTATSGVSEERPQSHQDAELAEQKASRKGKYAKPEKGTPNGFLIAAVIFLFLAVCVVTYFIGDMIGFWPGLEDKIIRETQDISSLTQVKCSQLVVDPVSIEFAAPGETQIVTVRVNADCTEVTYCTSSNAAVAVISQEGETNEGAQMKSASFLITATGGGEAELTFACGEKSAVCHVTCIEETTVPTETVQTFFPELNITSTLVLTQEGAQAIVRVMNAPSVATTTFSSSDEAVITVNQDGFITAVGEGSAKVIADVDGYLTELTVDVDFSEEGPHLDDVEFELDVDKYFRLFLLDEDNDKIKDVPFVIEDTTICEFDKERIYGLTEGITQIFATYLDRTYVCVVTVVE